MSIDVCVADLPKLQECPGAYYEFDTKSTFPRFLKYAYSPQIPAALTRPSSMRYSQWTVGKPGSTDRIVMESGRTEESQFKNTLAQAIKKAESDERMDKLANPCIVALIDKAGVAMTDISR